MKSQMFIQTNIIQAQHQSMVPCSHSTQILRDLNSIKSIFDSTNSCTLTHWLHMVLQKMVTIALGNSLSPLGTKSLPVPMNDESLSFDLQEQSSVTFEMTFQKNVCKMSTSLSNVLNESIFSCQPMQIVIFDQQLLWVIPWNMCQPWHLSIKIQESVSQRT